MKTLDRPDNGRKTIRSFLRDVANDVFSHPGLAGFTPSGPGCLPVGVRMLPPQPEVAERHLCRGQRHRDTSSPTRERHHRRRLRHATQRAAG